MRRPSIEERVTAIAIDRRRRVLIGPALILGVVLFFAAGFGFPWTRPPSSGNGRGILIVEENGIWTLRDTFSSTRVPHMLAARVTFRDEPAKSEKWFDLPRRVQTVSVRVDQASPTRAPESGEFKEIFNRLIDAAAASPSDPFHKLALQVRNPRVVRFDWRPVASLGSIVLFAFAALLAIRPNPHTLRRLRLTRSQCPGCTYDTSSLPSNRCPECGETLKE
jgi:hypothetical protein